MALVTATITIDFTANYAGTHRICWRIQGSGDPYDCATTVNCVGSGATCQAIINPTVNTTSCDGTVVFEGYIQAACEDILSVSGRLVWTADFVPNQVCDKFNITCEIGTATNPGGWLTDRGENYIALDPIILTRQLGDTQILDAIVNVATVGDGVINSVPGLQAPGTGYAATDTIDIAGVAGAGAFITVDSTIGGGEIATFTLTNGGAGYIGPLTFAVTSGAGVGGSFDITEGVDYNDFGSILTLNISNAGLYSIKPTVSVTSGTGSGALFTEAELTKCPEWLALGNDCIGSTPVDVLDQTLSVGSTFSTCLVGGIAATPARYAVTELGCCIPADTANIVCTDHHIDNLSGGPVDIHITHCGGDDEILSVPLGTTAVCLVANGYIDPFVAGVTITDIGSSCT